MRKELFAATVLREQEIRYYLLTEEDLFGAGVEYGGETVLLHGLSDTRSAVESLLWAMFRGCVTPTTVRDVAEDWFAGGNH